MDCARILLSDALQVFRANNGFGLILPQRSGLVQCLRAHTLYKR